MLCASGGSDNDTFISRTVGSSLVGIRQVFARNILRSSSTLFEPSSWSWFAQSSAAHATRLSQVAADVQTCAQTPSYLNWSCGEESG